MLHKEDLDECGLTMSNVGRVWIHMKVLKVLLKTDVYGEPVSIRHVNLLHQKTTADEANQTTTLLHFMTDISSFS